MTDAAQPELSADILDRPIDGVHLSGETLRAELDRGPTLLAFLRHFG